MKLGYARLNNFYCQYLFSKALALISERTTTMRISKIVLAAVLSTGLAITPVVAGENARAAGAGAAGQEAGGAAGGAGLSSLAIAGLVVAATIGLAVAAGADSQPAAPVVADPTPATPTPTPTTTTATSTSTSTGT